MSSPSRQACLRQAIEDACTPRVDEASLAGRSPLADPSFGLAWSNRVASDEVLVRAAIAHGAFHMVLEAVLHHGLKFVERQLEIMQSDEDAALPDRALAEVRRKLANIGRGLATAGFPDQG
jgi:hypothetical protein